MNIKPKRVIVTVTNDLVTDQRVARTCRTLVEMGFEVVLIGRKLKKSLLLSNCNYKCIRMRLLINKGPLFYACFNIRLFFLLLFSRYNLVVANDLDTLPACFAASKIKKKTIVYDSHEYFTGVPELEGHPFKKSVWKWIEKLIVPKLKDVITVNDSIAGLYKAEYNIDVVVVRNVPESKLIPDGSFRAELGMPLDKKILILQGAGINVNRGAEEAVMAMKYVENALLVIIGGGDVLPVLVQIVKDFNLYERVMFIPKLLPEELVKYTVSADIGLTLDKNTNINYLFSLPNKLFDYIHAGIPVLASRLPEVEKIINKYNLGTFIENHDINHIADKIEACFRDTNNFDVWKKNAKIASAELCWRNEEKFFKYVYEKYL